MLERDVLAPVTPVRGEPDPREVLERGLSDLRGETVRIIEMSGEPMHTFSTHPIYRLRVTLDDGEELRVIFKRLRPQPDRDTRGEVMMYRQLLAGRRFGAPELYASLHDDEWELYWLFLEDVGEWKLEYCGADGWMAAFRVIADMHAEHYGREENLRALGCLGELVAAFYRGLAEGARRSLRERGEPHALAHFETLTARYLEPSAAYLLSRPRTLVHGDMWCRNVMVRGELDVRPIDWEWAAIGTPAWDVSKLLSGWGPQKPRFIAVYLDEFESRAGVPIDRSAFERELGHCEVMQKLWRLRWWTAGCDDPEFVEGLLDRVGSAWRSLAGEERDG